MRLLHVDRIRLEEFSEHSAPPYAILSHTWREQEISFHAITTGDLTGRLGLSKVRACCAQARTDGLQYVWIDTCCIDKSSSSELSEAINSMFRWYQRARHCYVFLDDYSICKQGTPRLCDHTQYIQTANGDGFCKTCFRQCRWFNRGWTLQELLAPMTLKFYDKTWEYIGYSGHEPSLQSNDNGKSLSVDIQEVTNIPLGIINRIEQLSSASVAQRFSWASRRETSRPEDIAYCLLGLFDVSMPLLYGEGTEKAFIRLQEQIMKVCDDQSILAWGVESTVKGLVWNHAAWIDELALGAPESSVDTARYAVGPVLAPSPFYFEHSSHIVPTGRSRTSAAGPHIMTSRGLRISLCFLENGRTLEYNKVSLSLQRVLKGMKAFRNNAQSSPRYRGLFYVALGCICTKNPGLFLTMCITRLGRHVFARVLCEHDLPATFTRPVYSGSNATALYLLQQQELQTFQSFNTTSGAVICVLGTVPKRFGRCVDVHPPESYDHETGNISVLPTTQWTVLLYEVTWGWRRRSGVALALRYDGSKWHGVFEQFKLPVTAQNVYDKVCSHASFIIGDGDNWKQYFRFGSSFSPKACVMFAQEDLVIGGLLRLTIFEVDYSGSVFVTLQTPSGHTPQSSIAYSID